MVEQGLYRRDMEYGKAYTLQFVDRRITAPK